MTINADLQFIIGASLIMLSVIFILLSSPYNTRPITAAGISMIAATIISFIPHEKECVCELCCNYVGTLNGISIYENNNNIYYKNLQGMYIEITQNDGTSYTYNEYLQDQLKEVQ